MANWWTKWNVAAFLGLIHSNSCWKINPLAIYQDIPHSTIIPKINLGKNVVINLDLFKVMLFSNGKKGLFWKYCRAELYEANASYSCYWGANKVLMHFVCFDLSLAQNQGMRVYQETLVQENLCDQKFLNLGMPSHNALWLKCLRDCLPSLYLILTSALVFHCQVIITGKDYIFFPIMCFG